MPNDVGFWDQASVDGIIDAVQRKQSYSGLLIKGYPRRGDAAAVLSEAES